MHGTLQRHSGSRYLKESVGMHCMSELAVLERRTDPDCSTCMRSKMAPRAREVDACLLPISQDPKDRPSSRETSVK